MIIVRNYKENVWRNRKSKKGRKNTDIEYKFKRANNDPQNVTNTITFPFSIFIYFLHFSLCNNLVINARTPTIEAWIYVSTSFFSNIASATIGVGTAWPSAVPEFTTVFSGVRVARSLVSKSVEMFFSRNSDRNTICYERMGYIDFIDEGSARSLVFCVTFCGSLFALLNLYSISVFFLPFFDLRFLQTFSL
jgi:hypothetical protein